MLAIALFGAASAWSGVAQAAQPVCTGSENLISWPIANPLWEMCWLRPVDSSGANGSGLELRDIHYRGQLVLKRAHAPIVNVEYLKGIVHRRQRTLSRLRRAYLATPHRLHRGGLQSGRGYVPGRRR
jgi:hypothetical protein